MKVYNREKTQILEEYDITKGKLVNDTITIKHPEVKAVEEEGHYETVAEYENGGKDVKWVVEVAGVEYQPAREETEEIYVYVPYTDEELKRNEITHNIEVLKNNLTKTDYKLFKYVEGELTDDEYAPTKQKRKEWRYEINQLEKQIKELNQNL